MVDKKIADPGPLGLAGFGVTTCILSLINAGLLSAEAMGVVLGLAVAYGGIAQLLAGMWEFQKGNTFGATAFTSYGAFWVSFYFIIKDKPGAGVALYLFFFRIITFYFWIASFYLNRALFLVFFTLTVTFFLLALHDFGILESSVLGGWTGEITGLLALYASAAGVINSTAGREILPVGQPIKRMKAVSKLSA
jgi:succinate-acetate transporter protein